MLRFIQVVPRLSWKDWATLYHTAHRNFSGIHYPRNLLARCGGLLLCQCVQKPDVSLRPHRTTISNSGDSVSFVGPDAHRAHGDLDRCCRGNWNRLLTGMALCPKAIR